MLTVSCQFKSQLPISTSCFSIQNASTQKSEMEDLKKRTAEENVSLEKRKEAIEKELAVIKPTVDAARDAVGNIKSDALSEIRSLRAPPTVIRDILEGVLTLLGIYDTSWVSMKRYCYCSEVNIKYLSLK